MAQSYALPTLCGAALLFVGLYGVKTHADTPVVNSSANRSVLYITYAADNERRCAGKEHVGYRANAECCPEGFSLAGVRLNGEVADAVCVQD